MSKTTNIQSKVADTVLQRGTEVTLGGKRYSVAPPTLATLILVSEKIANLPIAFAEVGNDIGSKISVALKYAKDCRELPEIYAIIILGEKHINDEIEAPKKGLFCRKNKPRRKIEALAEEIARNSTPSQMLEQMIPLITSLELTDFFALTTFLTGINLTKPTKVETEQTASGQ